MVIPNKERFRSTNMQREKVNDGAGVLLDQVSLEISVRSFYKSKA